MIKFYEKVLTSADSNLGRFLRHNSSASIYQSVKTQSVFSAGVQRRQIERLVSAQAYSIRNT